jgi:iron(III) transport system substrate-binding protein
VRSRILSIASATLLLLGAAACGDSSDDANAEPDSSPTSAESSGETDGGDTTDFDAETIEALGGEESAAYLDQLYEEALDAGQTTITVYGITATSSASLYEAFSERFEGITVEHVTIAGAELQNRIASEQATGQHVVDNVSVSGADAVFLSDEGFVAEQEPPLAELLDEEYKPAGNTLFGGNTYIYTIAYNTDLVSEDEVPRSLDDLLDPRWAGEVGLSDPNVGATNVIYHPIVEGTLDESWLEDFRDTDPVLFPSERDLFTAVSTGQVPIGVGNYIRGEAFLAVDDLPVGFVADLEEGVADGVFYRGTVENAPNPLASDLLVAWWLTPEAQGLIAEQGQPGLMPDAPEVPSVGPLSEITVNPGPSFEEYADYTTAARELFQQVFS